MPSNKIENIPQTVDEYLTQLGLKENARQRREIHHELKNFQEDPDHLIRRSLNCAVDEAEVNIQFEMLLEQMGPMYWGKRNRSHLDTDAPEFDQDRPVNEQISSFRILRRALLFTCQNWRKKQKNRLRSRQSLREDTTQNVAGSSSINLSLRKTSSTVSDYNPSEEARETQSDFESHEPERKKAESPELEKRKAGKKLSWPITFNNGYSRFPIGTIFWVSWKMKSEGRPAGWYVDWNDHGLKSLLPCVYERDAAHTWSVIHDDDSFTLVKRSHGIGNPGKRIYESSGASRRVQKASSRTPEVVSAEIISSSARESTQPKNKQSIPSATSTETYTQGLSDREAARTSKVPSPANIRSRVRLYQDSRHTIPFASTSDYYASRSPTVSTGRGIIRDENDAVVQSYALSNAEPTGENATTYTTKLMSPPPTTNFGREARLGDRFVRTDGRTLTDSLINCRSGQHESSVSKKRQHPDLDDLVLTKRPRTYNADSTNRPTAIELQSIPIKKATLELCVLNRGGEWVRWEYGKLSEHNVQSLFEKVTESNSLRSGFHQLKLYLTHSKGESEYRVQREDQDGYQKVVDMIKRAMKRVLQEEMPSECFELHMEPQFDDIEIDF